MAAVQLVTLLSRRLRVILIMSPVEFLETDQE